MDQIKLVEEKKNKNVEMKIYKGYHCTLKICRLLFDENNIEYMIEHDNPIYSPQIFPIKSTEDFFFDFSQIMVGYKDFEEVKDCLTDIQNFCNEFIKRKKEFGFIKQTTD